MNFSNVLKTIGTSVSNIAGTTGLKIKKYSPEILFVTGIVTMGGSIISAIIAAQNQDEIMLEHEERLELARLGYTPEEYAKGEDIIVNEDGSIEAIDDEKEIRKKVTKAYITTGVELTKNYALTAVLAGVSVASFTGMHNIQAGRITGLTTAYTGLKEYIDRYEKNNIELYGIENHNRCKYGYNTEEIETVNIDGSKETITKTTAKSYEDVMNAPYHDQLVYFSRNTTPMFKGIPQYDLITLDAAENYIQMLVESRGWACVNDALDSLGMQRTKQGMIEGWVKGKGDLVSFGHRDPINARFISGYNTEAVLLDFNVHGNVYSLI